MPPPDPPPEVTSSDSRPRVPRALVIEDIGDVCDFLVSDLESAGFDVAQAATGEEGLERVRRFEPDIIVLDLMLPGLSGFSVARMVRARERGGVRNTAILAVSALTSPSLRAEAIESGCDAFLAKPVVSPTVAEEALRLLALRQAVHATA